jgi:hypothetical protein
MQNKGANEYAAADLVDFMEIDDLCELVSRCLESHPRR